MNWFQDQLKIGFQTIEDNAGQEGRYQRGELATEIKLTAALTRNSTADAGGRTLIAHRTLSILVRRELLSIDGQVIQPQMGDRITADDGRRFQVVADPATKQCWQWSDASRIYYRINVDEIKSL